MISLAQLISQFDHQKPFVIPSDWLQGRTVYGGLTAALALQSVLLSEGGSSLPPLRSASFAFVGPAVPPLIFHPRILRAGKSVTSVAVEAVSEAGAALDGFMVFGQARQSALCYDSAQMPNVKPPSGCAVWPEDVMPDFLRHFEVRQAGVAFPLAGAEAPEFLVWVRHRDASLVDPTVALVALADCLPPAAMNFFKAPAPISTVTWSFDILEPVSREDWLLMRSYGGQARDGYSAQDMEIWTESGKRLLWGRQNVAIFA